MIKKSLIFFGQNVMHACDGKCGKAWGRWGEHKRPRVQISKDVDDWAYLADGELGDAPIVSDVTISPSRALSADYKLPKWATHVAWYNR